MHTLLSIIWLMHIFRFRRVHPAASPLALDTRAVAPYMYGYCASIQVWVLFGSCRYVLAASLMRHFTETTLFSWLLSP